MRSTALKLLLLVGISFPVAFLGYNDAYSSARAEAAGGAAVVDAGAAEALPDLASVTVASATSDLAPAPTPTPAPDAVKAEPAAPKVAQPAPAAGYASSPADQIHDPITHPVETISDVKAAKRYGWAAVVFAVVLILARLAGKAQRIPWLSWLGRGTASIVVAAAAAVGAAGYNALVEGGSALAALFAAALAVATVWNPTAPQTKPQS